MKIDPTVMYHFTNPEGWKGVNEGDDGFTCLDPRTGKYVDGETIRGLWPSRRLIPQGVESSLVPFEATKPVIWGLPKERPKSWLNYKDGRRDIFEQLMSCCARRSNLVLLKVNLKPEDEACVVDYASIRQYSKEYNSENDWQKKAKIEAEAHKRYWESRVPIVDYQGDYILPEIVVANPIPQDRVNFLWERDLDDFLEEICGGRN